MTKKPLVSIVIPVFNGSPYLKETVSSVLNSDYKPLEIILVDDGSTDKSQVICQELTKKFKNVHYFHFKKNRGMAYALNLGVKKAKGKYIARLNQDDLMVKNRLLKQVEFLEKNSDYVAVGGAIKLFTNKKKEIGTVNFPQSDEKIRKQWLFLSPFSDPTVMYRKSSWLKTSGYNQRFWPADDVHMWYQLGKIGKLINLKDILTKVRWHDGAGSIKFHRLQMKKTWKVHVWASKNVEPATLSHWLFWISQYIAGVILPAQFNWLTYRLLRKFQNLKTKKPQTIVAKVKLQPSQLSISGA